MGWAVSRHPPSRQREGAVKPPALPIQDLDPDSTPERAVALDRQLTCGYLRVNDDSDSDLELSHSYQRSTAHARTSRCGAAGLVQSRRGGIQELDWANYLRHHSHQVAAIHAAVSGSHATLLALVALRSKQIACLLVVEHLAVPLPQACAIDAELADDASFLDVTIA
jgi:hypothetical protein